MIEQELKELLQRIQARQCEEQVIEVKSAHGGCPEKLYDTLSSFSNQSSGGTIVFGLDEKHGYKKVGVYNSQDLQKKIGEHCLQMTPQIRPVLTVYSENDMSFVSAEIPPIDVTERPCFKTAMGRLNGSYIRIGDADVKMTEREVYSYEAFRKKYQEDIRPVEQATLESLEQGRLEEYLARKKANRPHLASVTLEQLYELTGITRKGNITLAAVLLFGIYPQAYFPQLAIIATSVPGTEMGVLNADGQRFLNSKRIEGSLPDMLEDALAFVQNNMKVATRIDKNTGKREDEPQYPLDAVREAILNALLHRDYSIHTEGMPVQVIMYSDRLEIISPGGLYGRLTLDQLGNVQPDARNPVLITAMETLGKTENRYSGIPSIRRAMRELGLPAPVFADKRGEFSVCLYNSEDKNKKILKARLVKPPAHHPDEKNLLEFCTTPRSRQEIIDYLGVASGQYALRRYLDPLVRDGLIQMSIPDKPKSQRQRYQTAGVD